MAEINNHINNFLLKTKIESSKSNEKIEGSIIRELAQSKKVLGEIKRSGNIELYNKMLKEHEELKQTILKALEGDKKFSQVERKKILLEFTHSIYLSKGKTDIGTINKAIAYLSYGWNSSTSVFSGEESIEGYNTKDITKLDKTELNLLQESLINDIIGENNNYDNKYLKGYNNEKGNYLIEIKKFEEEINIKNIKNIDSITLGSYLEYLNSKGKLNIETLENKFGKEKLKELSELWKNNKGETITQELLGKLGLDSIIEKVISFSDIIENPEETIPKLTKIPTKEEIKNTPLSDLQNFNEKYNKTCPGLSEDDMKKFDTILGLSKQAEIEIKGESNFKKEVISIIKEKIKDKKLSKKQEKILLEKAEKNAKSIFDKGLEILKNPDEACGFDLTIFIQDEINKFLKENDLSEISEQDRQKLAKTVATTHLETKKEETKTIQQKIDVLESKKNKTPEEIKKLEKLKKQLNKKKQEVKIAERIVETSQASDKEIKEYLNIIKNGGTKEEAYKNFKENKLTNNIIESEEFYKAKTINYPNGDTLTYIKTPDGYNIDNGKEGNEGIDITKNEFNTIKNNPEAKENLINFYEFFKKLNLESVWKYRYELMLSIGNRNIDLLDNNSLSKGELIQFGNSLIISLNNLISNNKELNKKEQLSTSNSLNGIQNELRKFSGAGSILNDDKTYNNLGEDAFASTLRNFGIIGGTYFKINTFRETTKNKIDK